MRNAKQALAILLAVTSHLTAAIDLYVTEENSIKNVSRIIAYDLMQYYTGNITNTPSTIGILPKPYYWWEAGAMWGALLDYYHFTNDSSYNNVTTQALLSQVGPDWDYMVPAQQSDEGNDDQAFWGFSIMSAAEKDYPQPTIGNYSWIQLTENLWNTQVRRWDTESCNGGLKWQIFSSNSYGYDYKNSVSNGAFFQLSARLARFTGNQTYVDWANKVYDWTYNIGLIDPNYQVFDGYSDLNNCTGGPDELVWTYNIGILLYGSAVLYNYTNGSSLWAERTQGFLNETANMFNPYPNTTNIMYEPACETVNTCDNDQYSFKGYLSRFMWASTLLAPFTADAVYTLLADTSLAAAQACSGGEDRVTCGQKWYVGGYDGRPGVGQQMSALETIQGLLISGSVPPLHSDQVHLRPAETMTTAPVPSRTATASPSKTNAASCVAPQARRVLWMVLSAVVMRAFW